MESNVIIDPLFGTMRRSSSGLFWRGKVVTRKFGRVALSVQGEGTISEESRHSFALYVANEHRICEDAQEYLFECYKRSLRVVHGNPLCQVDLQNPVVRSAEIWSNLEKPFDGGTSLSVLFSREKKAFITLGWNCTWDPEGGALVCIEDGHLVDRIRSLELM